jgi:hypothetical protein
MFQTTVVGLMFQAGYIHLMVTLVFSQMMVLLRCQLLASLHERWKVYFVQEEAQMKLSKRQ